MKLLVCIDVGDKNVRKRASTESYLIENRNKFMSWHCLLQHAMKAYGGAEV
jgi:hypothetical protein